MDAINLALTTLLKADVIAAGATGFFRGEADQGAPVPYVVYRKQSGTSAGVTHDGKDIPARYVYLFKCVDRGESTIRAEAILAVVHERLHKQVLDVPGHGSLPVFWASDIEYVETVKGMQFQHVGKLYRLGVTP